MFRHPFTKYFMWSIAALGAAILLFSASRLNYAEIDIRFLLLAITTIFISSRIGVKIPQANTNITVSDTFIFMTMLMYGADAAVVLAGIEGACSSSRVGRKAITILFNSGVMACSTFFAATVVELLIAPVDSLHTHGYTSAFITALCILALMQYIANSGLIAIGLALKTDQPVWPTWKNYYLWSSISYFVGASAAGITVSLIAGSKFYAFLVSVPIIAILYFTYRTYLRSIEASEAQAEQARKHVEELSLYISEQERLREQFSQMEKLSALGELSSGVAHDFNNTLAGILGRAQLLQRTNDLDKIKRGLEVIIKAAEDGAHTVKRIQDFARQRRDRDLEPIQIDQIVLDACEITRPRWKNQAEAESIQIALALHINSKACVLGDASELREVLVNMIFNSLDAMPSGGRLTLSTEERDGFVEISVSDTGSGISPDAKARIFDPFFTTKGKAGLGLGLAVSFGIIRRHEGKVEVETEMGQGTTFKIKLPVARILAQPSTVQAEPLPVFDSKDSEQMRFLVVDDEEPVRQLLSDVLESEGHEVILAASGREALALLEGVEGTQFDAIFTDIGMPGMNGWELARAIRHLDEKIPLAVVTGWGDAVSAEERVAAQVNWVVTKPFTVPRILEIADEVVEHCAADTERKSMVLVA